MQDIAHSYTATITSFTIFSLITSLQCNLCGDPRTHHPIPAVSESHLVLVSAVCVQHCHCSSTQGSSSHATPHQGKFSSGQCTVLFSRKLSHFFMENDNAALTYGRRLRVTVSRNTGRRNKSRRVSCMLSVGSVREVDAIRLRWAKF